MKPIAWTLLAAALLATGCQTSPSNIYYVRFVTDPDIKLDGRLTEPAWQKAATLTDFTDPWAGPKPPATNDLPMPSTRFRAFCDQKNLYFAFEAVDHDLVIQKEWKGESTLDNEDRVEIYFAPDAGLSKYYCIEIDAEGRVHDFVGAFPRKFDSAWDMPGLKTAARHEGNTYVVEGMIPLATLAQLGMPSLRDNATLRVGLFRADLGKSGPKSDRWMTWIVPATDRPDFHTPGAFGAFRMPPNCNCR